MGGGGKTSEKGSDDDKGRGRGKHHRSGNEEVKERSRPRRQESGGKSAQDVDTLRMKVLEAAEEKAKAIQEMKKYRDRYDAERKETKRLQKLVGSSEPRRSASGRISSSDKVAVVEERDALKARVSELEQALAAKDKEVKNVEQRCSELEKSAAAARSAAEAAKVAAEAAGSSASEYNKDLERLRNIEVLYKALKAEREKEEKDRSAVAQVAEAHEEEKAAAVAPAPTPGSPRAASDLERQLHESQQKNLAVETEKEELERALEEQREALEKSTEQVGSLKQELETLVGMAEELDHDLQVEKKSHTQTKRSIYVLEELVEELQEKQKQLNSSNSSAGLSIPLSESASQPLLSPRGRDKSSRKSKMWPFRKEKKIVPRNVSSGADSRRDMAAGPDSKHHYVSSVDMQPKPMAETQMRKELEVLVLLGEKLQEELQAERKAHAESKEILLEQQLTIEQLQAEGGGQQEKRRRGLEVSSRLKIAGRKRSRTPAPEEAPRRTSEPSSHKQEKSELREDKSRVLVSNALNAPPWSEGAEHSASPKVELDANLREAAHLTRMVVNSLEGAS